MTRQVRKPRNIDYAQSSRLQSKAIAAGIDLPPGYELYVTDSRNGRFRVNSLTCTVPLWATKTDFKNKPNDDFELYYAAHEAAHAWVHYDAIRDSSSHGPRFYEHFKRLCPANLWHHELGYKTRESKKAGISEDPATNEATAYGFENIRPVPIAAGPTQDDAAYEDYVRANPKLAAALKKRHVPDHERKSFIRGWAKLDK